MGQQAFTAYPVKIKTWGALHDPVSLILQGAKLPEILLTVIMTLFEDQLRTKSLERVCNEMNINTSFRYHILVTTTAIISFPALLVSTLLTCQQCSGCQHELISSLRKCVCLIFQA